MCSSDLLKMSKNRNKKTVTVKLLELRKEFWDSDKPHLKAEMYYRGKLLKVFGGYDDLRLTTRAGNWAVREGFTHIIWD